MNLPILPRPVPSAHTMASAMRAGELRRKSRTFLRISASQIESFDEAGAGGGGCRRKWWSDSVARVREPATAAQAFGTVLHSVIERFLGADDLGYAPSQPGRPPEPVDIYPRGWERPMDREGAAQPGALFADEQALVKDIIAQAIASGMLSRRVGRRIEAPIYLPVLAASGGLPGVGLSGFADLIHTPVDLADESPEAWEVQDHKSVKNRRYAKTEATLRTNHQVLIYAKWLLTEARKMGANPKTIRVRHNNYPKVSDMAPWFVVVDLTVEQIEAHWVRIEQIAHEMRVARVKAFRITDLDLPESGKPCQAYGGCPLFMVCGAGKHYEAHVAELAGRHAAPAFASIPVRVEVRGPAPADRAAGGTAASVLSAPLPRGPVGPSLP